MLRAMREVDNGVSLEVVCRQVGMAPKTFYRYRAPGARRLGTVADRDQ